MGLDKYTYFNFPILVMPAAAQVAVTWVFGIILVAMIVIASWISIKNRSPDSLLYLLGAGLCIFLESFCAFAGHATHAVVGQWTMWEIFARAVPWYVLFAYVFYYGTNYLLFAAALTERRWTTRAIWILYFGLVVSTWLFEANPIRIGLWTYYGNQPLQPFGLMPLWFSFANAVSVLIPLAIVASLRRRLRGAARSLIALAIPMTTIGSHFGVAWPMYNALNSTAGPALVQFASLATIGLCVVAVSMIIPLVAREEKRAIEI